jgi:hypothetical protein
MGQTVTGGSFDIDRLKKIRLAGKKLFRPRFTSAKANCQVISYTAIATGSILRLCFSGQYYLL